MAQILVKRGTRAQLDAAATAGELATGEPYLITDEDRIAVGTSATTYEVYAKHGEIGAGGTAGPLDGFTATEAVTAGEVVVIEEGSQDVTPVQVDATTYTFEEIQRAVFDSDTGNTSSSSYVTILELSPGTYFLAYGEEQDGSSYGRIMCRIVTATTVGLSLGPEYDSGIALDVAERYVQACQFSASRVFLRDGYDGEAAIATVDGTTVTFTSIFTVSTSDLGLYYTDYAQAAEGVLLAIYEGAGDTVWARTVIDNTSGVSLGPAIQIDDSSWWNFPGFPVVRLSGGKFIAALTNGTSKPRWVALSVSGHTVTAGTPAEPGTAVDSPRRQTLVPFASDKAAAFWASNGSIYGLVLTVADDLTLTVGGSSTHAPASTAYYLSMAGALLDAEHVSLLVGVSSSVGHLSVVADISSGSGISWTETEHYISPPADPKSTGYEYSRMYHLGSGVCIAAYQGIALLHRAGYTGIATTNIDGALGVIDTGGAALDPVTLWPLGDVASSFSGLTPGVDYYLHEDGTVDVFKTSNSRYLGTAVSATKMLTVPMILNRYQPHHQGTDLTLAAGTINEVMASELRAMLDNPSGSEADQIPYDNATSGLVATDVQAAIDEVAADAGGGVSDHGALSGLADDDHSQYHTDARGDVRYYPRADADAAFEAAGTTATHEAAGDPHPDYRLESDSYSQTETDAAIAAHADDIAGSGVIGHAPSTTGASDGDVLTVQGDGSTAWETPAAGGGDTGVMTTSPRQSILSCAVDANGLPAILSDSAGDVAIDCTTAPLVLSFAGGFNASGPVDYYERVTVDGSVAASSLTADMRNYIYSQRDGAGSVSYGVTIVAPVYQHDEPSAPSSGDDWFNLNDYTMRNYNGASWDVVHRVYLGWVDVDSGGAITEAYSYSPGVYALRGVNGGSNVAVNTAYTEANPFGASPVEAVVELYSTLYTRWIRPLNMYTAGTGSYRGIRVRSVYRGYIEIKTARDDLTDSNEDGQSVTSALARVKIRRTF